MTNLGLIIRNEYRTDVLSKSFWIGTFLFPVILFIFGGVIGWLAADSEILREASNPALPDEEDLTGSQIAGMLCGIGLTFFLMIYGSMIFNKVKKEKSSRIVEVLATCVEGRTMMLAKIISVGLVGLTQLLAWAVLILMGVGALLLLFKPDIPWAELMRPELAADFLWLLLFFLGGYIFFGSLYAAFGAMSDKNDENQEYMVFLTFALLASFYLGEFVVDNPGSTLSMVCSFIPFTSPTVGCVNAIAGDTPLWVSLLSLAVLYLCAFGAVSFAGKLYTSTLLLRGRRFTPRDIIVFLKTK